MSRREQCFICEEHPAVRVGLCRACQTAIALGLFSHQAHIRAGSETAIGAQLAYARAGRGAALAYLEVKLGLRGGSNEALG